MGPKPPIQFFIPYSWARALRFAIYSDRYYTYAVDANFRVEPFVRRLSLIFPDISMTSGWKIVRATMNVYAYTSFKFRRQALLSFFFSLFTFLYLWLPPKCEMVTTHFHEKCHFHALNCYAHHIYCGCCFCLENCNFVHSLGSPRMSARSRRAATALAPFECVCGPADFAGDKARAFMDMGPRFYTIYFCPSAHNHIHILVVYFFFGRVVNIAFMELHIAIRRSKSTHVH